VKKLRVLDLFSGIGGFSLGLERTGGFETVAFCEINSKCRHLLAHHWPKVPCHDDICRLSGRDIGSIDAICGGFPCQDISLAGKGAGIGGSRSGLWSQYARLIGELRPQFVFVENVSALLVRGMGTVIGDLAALGYDAWWDCIPASAVGAPHRRDRLWIIAYAGGEQHEGFGDALRRAVAAELLGAFADTRLCDWVDAETDAQCPDAHGLGSHRAQEHIDGSPEFRDEQDGLIGSMGQDVAYPSGELRDGSGGGAELTGRDEPANCGQTLAYPSGQRQSETEQLRRDEPAQRVAGGSAVVADCTRARLEGYAGYGEIGGGKGQDGSTTPTCLRSGEHPGGWWLSEPDVGRVAHGVPARVDRLHGLGNAVVPEIPYRLGQAVLAARVELGLAA
jgi:DNA (cytosine-5)-methyltransferase 1